MCICAFNLCNIFLKVFHVSELSGSNINRIISPSGDVLESLTSIPVVSRKALHGDKCNLYNMAVDSSGSRSENEF